MNIRQANSDPFIEILPNRLYWHCGTIVPKRQSTTFIFSIDTKLVYHGFAHDFGPLNLAMVHRYCHKLNAILGNTQHQEKKIIHHCMRDAAKRANAAFLMGAFQIIVLGRTPEEAWAPFSRTQAFAPFRDACLGPCTYKCTILHCLQGLHFAIGAGWYDFNNFDLAFYEMREQVEYGDMNWIIPGKFLAFANPSSQTIDPIGLKLYTPEDYVPMFKEIGVTAVVRLNKKIYDSSRFTSRGIDHFELFFIDGSVPSDDIIRQFLEIAESHPGALAVHWKAGLGRTGSLIGIYAMKHYGIGAAEFIGWSRIARPGSILGPQQHFLHQVQKRLQGLISVPIEAIMMSPEDKRKATKGDLGQASALIAAKASHQASPVVKVNRSPPVRALSYSPQIRGMIVSPTKGMPKKSVNNRNIFNPENSSRS